MSLPESPVPTEAQQILDNLAQVNARLDRQAEGINSIGENLQWLVDNVKHLFQVFSSPGFMGQMMSAMNGQMELPVPTEEKEPV